MNKSFKVGKHKERETNDERLLICGSSSTLTPCALEHSSVGEKRQFSTGQMYWGP